MTDITYGIVLETYSPDDEARVSYGIAVYSHSEQDGTASIIASVHDITSDRERIANLVMMCNRGHLAPEHLNDVVEDLLVS